MRSAPQEPPRPAGTGTRRGMIFLWAAGVLGLVHASFSAYWALGGQWLPGTVGGYAVQARQESPVQASLVLGGAAQLKAAAAVIPLASEYGRFPFPRLIRVLCWAGGTGLVLYGAVNTAAASAVLAGWIPAAPDADLEGLEGHAWLWDPLFFAWGTALLVYLWLSRTGPAQPAPRSAG